MCLCRRYYCVFALSLVGLKSISIHILVHCMSAEDITHGKEQSRLVVLPPFFLVPDCSLSHGRRTYLHGRYDYCVSSIYDHFISLQEETAVNRIWKSLKMNQETELLMEENDRLASDVSYVGNVIKL